MAYNHGRAERRWRLWKEKEEKILRECGVDENIIEKIRAFDRTEFNSDRRFYSRLNDIGEYIAETAIQESPMEVNTVWDMLNEIEDENLYLAYGGQAYPANRPAENAGICPKRDCAYR